MSGFRIPFAPAAKSGRTPPPPVRAISTTAVVGRGLKRRRKSAYDAEADGIDYQAMVDAASSLDDLLDILQSIGGSVDRMDEVVDMTSLPTFGGSEPSDTTGVWSWDETQLLVGTGSDDLQIVSRADWES